MCEHQVRNTQGLGLCTDQTGVCVVVHDEVAIRRLRLDGLKEHGFVDKHIGTFGKDVDLITHQGVSRDRYDAVGCLNPETHSWVHRLVAHLASQYAHIAL